MGKLFFEKYLSLRRELDEQCARLWKVHKMNMLCKSGCSSCCTAFKVLPVEFEYIRWQIKEMQLHLAGESAVGMCRFLIDNQCSIYSYRPSACRYEGFPIVRLNEELDEYEVSFCHLNFRKVTIKKFNSGNVFLEDDYLKRLLELNNNFIASFTETEYEPGEMVELNSLFGKQIAGRASGRKIS